MLSLIRAKFMWSRPGILKILIIILTFLSISGWMMAYKYYKKASIVIELDDFIEDIEDELCPKCPQRDFCC